jgi:hypothetical protein
MLNKVQNSEALLSELRKKKKKSKQFPLIDLGPLKTIFSKNVKDRSAQDIF